MAHFLKPSTVSSPRYVLDGDGTLKSVQVPLGETVVVDLWGGGDIVAGKGELLRVDVDNRGVATVSKKKDPGNDWISSWYVRGNMKDKAALVALDPSGRVFAKVPLEVTSLQAEHQWNTNQPAPQEVWRIATLNIPRTRWLGIWMPPGYEDHSEGRAVDLGLWEWVPEEKDVAEAIVEVLTKTMAEVGWSYFIWNRRIWLNDKPAPEVYKGKSAHTEHIHISWNRETSQRHVFPTFGAELAKIGSSYPGAGALGKKQRKELLGGDPDAKTMLGATIVAVETYGPARESVVIEFGEVQWELRPVRLLFEPAPPPTAQPELPPRGGREERMKNSRPDRMPV